MATATTATTTTTSAAAKSIEAGSNVLIIGATRGIGLQLATQAVAKGANVYATARKANDAIKAVKVTKLVEGVDVGDDGVEEVLKTALGDVAFDVVIHSAGVLGDGFLVDSIDKLDLSKFGSAFNINSVGPLRTVRAVTFADSAKFVIVSTMMASVGTSGLNAPFPMPAAYNYRMSKAATNMAMVLLAADLKPKNVAVLAIHPGYVETEMTLGMGAKAGEGGCISPTESAAGILKVADELSIDTTGSYKTYSGDTLEW